MKAAVFFLCLCFLLLSGAEHIHASSSPPKKISSAAAHSFRHIQKHTSTKPDHSFIQNNSSKDKDEYLIAVEDEDEDTNNVIDRKFKLLSREYSILTDTFITGYFNISSKTQLTAPRHLLYKYITQRVIRV